MTRTKGIPVPRSEPQAPYSSLFPPISPLTSHAQSSVTRAAARIRERISGDWNELPRIRPVRERELQHSVRVVVPHFAVRERGRERVEAGPAGADHELADPPDGVRDGARGLGRKPLVLVVVPDDHDLRPCVV